MNLVIVESPTKCKTIQKILNNIESDSGSKSKFKVVSSKGHICDLVKNKGKFGLGINFETLEPLYAILKEKSALVKELKKEVKQAETVYIATDPDREGEAIGYHLANFLNLDLKKCKRIEFFEITKSGIQESLKHPREINNNTVNSQETRRMLDRIVGFRLSKLLRGKMGSNSAGRVQSVALKLICDKEKEINDFVSEDYFTIDAVLDNNIKIRLIKENNIRMNICSKDHAEKIKNSLSKEFNLNEVEEKTISIKQPQPLITSTILQKSPYNTKKTESILQELFEGIKIKNELKGLITYHRTDSKRLSLEFIKSANDYVSSTYGKEYVGEIIAVKNNENAQDAHEAIRPTDITNKADSIKEYLSPEQFIIYKLIYEYAVGSTMASAKMKIKNFLFKNDIYTFKCSFNNIDFLGFKALITEEETKEDENIKIKVSDQDIVYKNEKHNFEKHHDYLSKNININEHKTKAPARYNEAKLIKVLEELGIGRPSTYGKIIFNIKNSSYIEIEDRRFKPTERGEFTNKYLQENFNSVINEKFTSNLEKTLDEISRDKINHKEYVKDFFETFEKLVSAGFANKTDVKGIPTHRKCPSCTDGNLVIRKGRFGDFISCDTYPNCKYIENIKKQVEVKKVDHNCPKCGSELKVRFSKKTKKPFFGCSAFPKCDYMEFYSLAKIVKEDLKDNTIIDTNNNQEKT